MNSPLPAFNTLTASAQILKPQRRLAPKYESWQTELWDYYDRLGEYNDGVSWKAKTMSRVRLCAAEVVPGGDEPTRIDEGPAAEAVERLAGGTGGQSQLMKEATIHLSVPGEGWLVGERGISEERMAEEGLTTDEWWSIRSADEIRPSSKRDESGRATFEVMDEMSVWRPISADSIVVRIWEPHARRGWEADSAARHARGAMLKLDMINKRIVATIMSRLAGNGILIYDTSRLSTPVNKGPTEDADENVDPFALMLVEAASRGIADPASAEALIPLPVGADIGDMENFDPELLMRHITFSNPLDEKLMEQREAAVRELARSLDMPADVMLGLSEVNHWCKPGDTSIFTREGWRSADDISPGVEVLTLNHDTGSSEWQPVVEIYRAPVVKQRMLAVTASGARGPSFTFTATPNHRYPILRDGERVMVRGYELRDGDVLTRGAQSDAPTEAKFSDALVQLLAWYSADGTLTSRANGKRGQVRIAKSWRRNPAATAKLIAVLTVLFGEARETMPHGAAPSWRMERQSRGMMVAVLNASARDVLLDLVPGKDKVIPPSLVEHFTAGQRELFIQAWLDSDGYQRTRTDEGAGEVTQRVTQRLDALERAAILTGRAVRRFSKDHVSGFTGPGVMHHLRIGSQPQATVRSVEETTYTGVVWCPVTANGTWLAREPDGWTEYTGNTAWQIDESGIKIHISPAAETVTHALTKGYLIPTLRAAGADLIGPSGGRLIVWYDTSEITQRPDRSQNIVAAYDRYEVSGKTLRREIGADEDDAPNAVEFREMVRKRIASSPFHAQSILAAMDDSPTPRNDAQDVDDTVDEPDEPVTGPPDTRDEPPPAPDDDMATAVLVEFFSSEDWTERFQKMVNADPTLASVLVDEVGKIPAMFGESERRSVLVPAGTAHENRATRSRRNGAKADQPVE